MDANHTVKWLAVLSFMDKWADRIKSDNLVVIDLLDYNNNPSHYDQMVSDQYIAALIKDYVNQTHFYLVPPDIKRGLDCAEITLEITQQFQELPDLKAITIQDIILVCAKAELDSIPKSMFPFTSHKPVDVV